MPRLTSVWGRGASRASITCSKYRAAILKYEGVIESSWHEVALACDRGCLRDQMPAYIILLLVEDVSIQLDIQSS